MKDIIFVGLMVAGTAFWTFMDRRFPSTRVPFIYQEKLWLNMLTNLVLMTTIGVIVWYVL